MEYTYIDRIKLLKNKKKITNEKLAELTGIPLGTLSKILAGVSDSPKLSNIIAICDVLDCTLDYIVSGTEKNDNNYTLNDSEIKFIESYRQLDEHGKELVLMVAEKEAERVAANKTAATKHNRKADGGFKPSLDSIVIGNAKKDANSLYVQNGFGKRSVVLYELPVSAGTGVFLDGVGTSDIMIPNTAKTKDADYALRISGNSMEPKYHNGDILLVEEADQIEVGEAGIFILDGAGYFKIFGGDRLVSLNPQYHDIPLRDFSEIICCGRVIGKLKRR